jgi:phosphoglycolate phosphatase-like HAD superfamily hydrolase
MLSMIETAIEVTERRVPASVIAEILTAGQEMLAHPIELLPEAEDTVRRLAESHTLVLITKGDLLDQERKLAQSGLGELFDAVEIVSDKRARSIPALSRPRRRPRQRDDDRQFDEVRRPAGDRGRGMGRLRAPWPDMGAGACKGTRGPSAIS